VRVLAARGANLNCQDLTRRTPLRVAALGGHSAIVRALLAFGADPALGGPDGKNALHEATLRGHLEIVRLLVPRCNTDARVNDGMMVQEETALMMAAQLGWLEIGRELIQGGAAVNAATADGYTPLIFAAKFGQLDFVNLLLIKGADRTRTSRDGRTAFDWLNRDARRQMEDRLAALQRQLALPRPRRG
jgi:ankyrin repeat protein